MAIPFDRAGRENPRLYATITDSALPGPVGVVGIALRRGLRSGASAPCVARFTIHGANPLIECTTPTFMHAFPARAEEFMRRCIFFARYQRLIVASKDDGLSVEAAVGVGERDCVCDDGNSIFGDSFELSSASLI